MVTVRGIEGQLITTESYTELIKAVKDQMDELKSFEPHAEFLTHRSAIVYINEIPEEGPKEPWSNRYCSECGYFWCRNGCPHKEGRITVKMPACSHFTIEWVEED